MSGHSTLHLHPQLTQGYAADVPLGEYLAALIGGIGCGSGTFQPSPGAEDTPLRLNISSPRLAGVLL